MDHLPIAGRPTRVLTHQQIAEITYTDRETGTVIWRQAFTSINPIPPPPIELPPGDYTVQITWREDW